MSLKNLGTLPKNMVNITFKLKIVLPLENLEWYRTFWTSSVKSNDHYRLVVAGGGTAGTSISNKFSRTLGKGHVALIEPKEQHHYQAVWLRVGAGHISEMAKSMRPQKDFVHKNCTLIQDRIEQFAPDRDALITKSGRQIFYDYLVIALGIDTRYDKIKGLTDALENKVPGVCSIFHPKYVLNVYPGIEAFKGGNAIFTFPEGRVKCAGAMHSIMYLAEEAFRKNGVRNKTTILFNSGTDILFPSPYYAEPLYELMKRRGLHLNRRHNLVEVNPFSKEAVFQTDDKNMQHLVTKYDFLHVGPPCSPVKELRENIQLTNDGWVTVNQHTMQHRKYSNIFALGDCTDAPAGKTAAAAAAQSGIVRRNLTSVMNNEEPHAFYDGYTSCPIVTGQKKCILPEFDYSLQPKETFPLFDQRKESRMVFLMKKAVMPFLYWRWCLPGHWEGTHTIRRILHLGLVNSNGNGRVEDVGPVKGC